MCRLRQAVWTTVKWPESSTGALAWATVYLSSSSAERKTISSETHGTIRTRSTPFWASRLTSSAPSTCPAWSESASSRRVWPTMAALSRASFGETSR